MLHFVLKAWIEHGGFKRCDSDVGGFFAMQAYKYACLRVYVCIYTCKFKYRSFKYTLSESKEGCKEVACFTYTYQQVRLKARRFSQGDSKTKQRCEWTYSPTPRVEVPKYILKHMIITIPSIRIYTPSLGILGP